MMPAIPGTPSATLERPGASTGAAAAGEEFDLAGQAGPSAAAAPELTWPAAQRSGPGEAPDEPLAPPANDTCAGAEVIPAAGPFPYTTALIGDITDATTTGD